MKREHVWVLDFCVPTWWTVDLTPPGGDWDREVEPGSLEEKIFKLEAMHYGIWHAARQVGKTVTAAAMESMEGFKKAADMFMNAVSQGWTPIHETLKVMDKVSEWEEAKHGTFTIKSQNPKIDLPIRKVNCGPPAPRLDRRRK